MQTRVFIPECLFEDLHRDPGMFSGQLIEIHREDVTSALCYWRYLDKLKRGKLKNADPSILRLSVAKAHWPKTVTMKLAGGDVTYKKGDKVLRQEALRDTLAPFLYRPHVHVNCCSKPGREDIREKFQQVAIEAGRLAGENGSNLWHGGAASGNMIDIQEGFEIAVGVGRYEHQYSVQIMSYDFVLGVESTNGGRPTNNGYLPERGDITIIKRTFSGREDLLQISPVASFNLPGGWGTIHGIGKQVGHAKIGQNNGRLYWVNTDGYYDPLAAQAERGREFGMDAAMTRDLYNIVPTPTEGFKDLMAWLGKKRHPQRIYERRLKLWGGLPVNGRH